MPFSGANAQWVGRSNRLAAFNARACQPGASSDDLCAIVVDVVSKYGCVYTTTTCTTMSDGSYKAAVMVRLHSPHFRS